MNRIDTNELRTLREQDEDTLLINVLPAKSFVERFIPGSLSVPLEDRDFIQQVEARAGDKNRHIVVYCAGPDCDASEKAASQLAEAGFTNVHDYEGGLAEWAEQGGKIASLTPTGAKS